MLKGWQKWIQALGDLKHLHFKRKALTVETKSIWLNSIHFHNKISQKARNSTKLP